jgi:hypothetical protein
MATATKRKKAPAPRRSYKLREGYRSPVKGEVVGETIEGLKNRKGEVTPQVVVESSRPDDAPLHPCFEWRDEVAAGLWRCDQASYLIRSYEIVEEADDREPVTYIANVSVINDEEERVYVGTDRAMGEEGLRLQVIAELERMLAGVAARYRGIPDLKGAFCEAVERLDLC